MSKRTDSTLHKRAKCVASLTLPYTWGDEDFLDIWRAGSKQAGYVYAVVTMSEGMSQWLWLTDEERVTVIEALGGRR